MTPEHTSTLELVRALHALDPSAAEIVVGDVAVRFNRLPAMPDVRLDHHTVDDLKVEVAALKMRLSQHEPDESSLY